MHGKVVGVEEEKGAVSKHLLDLLWIQGCYDLLIKAFLSSSTNHRVTSKYPNASNFSSTATEIENKERTLLIRNNKTTVFPLSLGA